MTLVQDWILLKATKDYLLRKAKKSHPKFWRSNKTGLKYLSKGEHCNCCKGIKKPSIRFPNSEMNHGRTAIHLANLYGVSREDILAKAQELRGIS